MGDEPAEHTDRLSRWERVILVIGGLGAFGLLAIAIALPPNPRGFGTHQQLGLPPCSILLLFDIPCPSCGGTTAFSLFVRGRWWDALQANAAAALFAGLCIAGIPWIAMSLRCGHYWKVRDPVLAILVMMVSLIVIATVQWGVRLQAWAG